jgi:16S rRNA (uracil1498-N3)-methyltransferase
VEAAVTPARFLSRGEQFDLPLIASLQPGSRHPREYFDEFRQRHGRLPASACVWVGPEGDFTLEEVEAVTKSGALPITLGPLVLRADTAAVYCLSILSYELQRS